jgi:hypothetical protein
MSVTGGSTTAVMKRDFTPHRPPLLIRYNQLDIEKVSALPDVPDSFAYKFKFVPPPGPLTPGKTRTAQGFPHHSASIDLQGWVAAR